MLELTERCFDAPNVGRIVFEKSEGISRFSKSENGAQTEINTMAKVITDMSSATTSTIGRH